MANKRKRQALPRGLSAGVYFDGFNLYHAINKMKKPHLKWTNLRSLAELFCRKYGANLETVVFCTALPENDRSKKERHKTFNTAQEAFSVRVILGHYLIHRSDGQLEEKQSDINLALAAILDAEDGLIELAIVVSAARSQRFAFRSGLGCIPDNAQAQSCAHISCTQASCTGRG